MKFNKNGMMDCYGEYSKKNEDCRKCRLKGYCNEAKTQDGKQLYKERTSAEIALAMGEYGTLPDVYENESGETSHTWEAVKRFLIFLISLHPTTLAALKYKLSRPDFCKSKIAAALGLTKGHVTDCITESPAPVRAVFQQNGNRKGNDASMIGPGDNVYIAGPMTGIEDSNYPAFHEAEERLTERYGCNVINPAFLPHLMGEGRTHVDYVTVSLALVATSDALILLPGWEDSPGACMERDEAMLTDKRIYLYSEIID